MTARQKMALDAVQLLDDPRLRQALGYLEDCAADEIWTPLRSWIADRDHVLRRANSLTCKHVWLSGEINPLTGDRCIACGVEYDDR